MSTYPINLYHPHIHAVVQVKNQSEEKAWTEQGWLKTKPKDLPTPPDSVLYDSQVSTVETPLPNVSPASPVEQVSQIEPAKKTK